MEQGDLLVNALVYLAAAVVAVPVSKRLGFGSILGYLAAGVAIGPWGMGLITDVRSILQISEFGIVLMLFLGGLEMNPARLWGMRRVVLAMGGGQVVLTLGLLTAACWMAGYPFAASLVAAMGMALSSTAVSLQTLEERNLEATLAGKTAFPVLLAQDIAVIPMLAMVPLLAGHSASGGIDWLGALEILAVIGGIVVGGRYLLRPVFRYIADTRMREIFTAFALMLVIGIALLMRAVDMSMALGAFMAGVLLADSEYRHELEINIEPFKGLLLGLFFISVGMSVELSVLLAHPWLVVGLVLGLAAVKTGLLFVLGRISRMGVSDAVIFGLVLSQGGEFAFVLYAMAEGAGILSAEARAFLVAIVALSMVMTPVLILLFNLILKTRLLGEAERSSDAEDEGHEVIIAGYGRFGQIVGRLLHSLQIPFTILESDPNQIEMLRKFGRKAFYGDASRLDMLKQAGAERAKYLVLAIDDPEKLLETARLVKAHFPHLKLMARARNRAAAIELIRLGVDRISRETFAAALELGEKTLLEMSHDGSRARRAAEIFKAHDKRNILHYATMEDYEGEVYSYAAQARAELEQLMRFDEEEGGQGRPGKGAN